MPEPAPIRVVQVLTSTHRRGAETFAVDLGAALAPRVDDVRTVALRAGSGAATVDVEVIGGRDPRARRRALRAAVAPADVVIAHGSSTLAATALATARVGSARPPFVYRLIGDPDYWATGPRRRAQVGALLHRAAAVATYHEAAADRLVARYGLRSERVWPIPKGIDPTGLDPVRPSEATAARTHLGLPPDGPVVAWVGALAPEKDPRLAADVAARVAGATLLVAGEGPLAADLRGRTGVHLAGAVTDVRAVLAAADVLLLTSRTEGVPGVVLEAGLVGLPVVSVDVGGVSSVVRDGATGRVVASRDPATLAAAVEEALAAGATWGAAAAAHLRAHATIDRVADRWVDLLSWVTLRHPR